MNDSNIKAVEFQKRNGLPNFFAKLEKCEELSVGYLGGSITLAEGYCVKIAKWFDKYGNRYRVHYSIIAQNLCDTWHEVILTIDTAPTDKSALLPSRPVEDLKQLNGVVCYISALLII